MVEHLFRHEAGKMVATLTGVFGLEHLTLAEDVVQEALARALPRWPVHGVRDNPSGWIMHCLRLLARLTQITGNAVAANVRLPAGRSRLPDTLCATARRL